MSTRETIANDPYRIDHIRYEVTGSEDAVTLSIKNNGHEVTVSTDRNSAVLLASDILKAVSQT